MTGSKTCSAVLALSLSLICMAPAFAEDPPAVTPPGTSPPPSPGGPTVGRPAPAGAPQPPSPAISDAGTPPELSLDYEHLSGSLRDGLLEGAPGKPVRLNYGGEFFIEADKVAGDLTRQSYSATGGVKAYDNFAMISADKLKFDGAEHTGVGENALVYLRPYRIQAGRIEATPLGLIATDGRLTTAPPGVSPDFEIRASKITLFQDPRIPSILRGVADNPSFYLFHNRVLTVRRLKFRSGAGAGAGAAPETSIAPSLGESGRYGLYAQIQLHGVGRSPIDGFLLLPTKQAPQARVTAHQTLIGGYVRPNPAPAAARRDPLSELHRIEQAASPPLPYGDPLLFHDFLPEAPPIRPFVLPWGGGVFAAEELSGHLAASGRRRDDLFVSRTPELRIDGSLPLAPVHAAPPPGDPVAFRRFLSRPVVYANAGFAAGQYFEQPTSIHGRRDRAQVGLSTRPWLVAPNTLILPAIQNTYNHYDGRRGTYQYTQTSLAIEHYYSDRTALGLEYRTSKVSGDSPFNFDVLDTSRELVTRAQIGNHNFALSGLVRFDLEHHDVLDYKVTVAPTLHGFIPTFTYNFQNRSLSINFEVEGISF